MSHEALGHDAQMRSTAVKSGLSGVAVTVLAVTMFSPAGFGGVIGTSLASGFGANANAGGATTDDVYGRLPAFPTPISQEELSDIRGRLARTEASLAITRAATDARIEHIRSIAMSDGVVTFTPMTSVGQIGAGIVTPSSALIEPTATAQMEQMVVPIVAEFAQPRASHLELAALLLAHENI